MWEGRGLFYSAGGLGCGVPGFGEDINLRGCVWRGSMRAVPLSLALQKQKWPPHSQKAGGGGMEGTKPSCSTPHISLEANIFPTSPNQKHFASLKPPGMTCLGERSLRAWGDWGYWRRLGGTGLAAGCSIKDSASSLFTLSRYRHRDHVSAWALGEVVFRQTKRSKKETQEKASYVLPKQRGRPVLVLFLAVL